MGCRKNVIRETLVRVHHERNFMRIYKTVQLFTKSEGREFLYQLRLIVVVVVGKAYHLGPAHGYFYQVVVVRDTPGFK